MLIKVYKRDDGLTVARREKSPDYVCPKYCLRFTTGVWMDTVGSCIHAATRHLYINSVELSSFPICAPCRTHTIGLGHFVAIKTVRSGRAAMPPMRVRNKIGYLLLLYCGRNKTLAHNTHTHTTYAAAHETILGLLIFFG